MKKKPKSQHKIYLWNRVNKEALNRDVLAKLSTAVLDEKDIDQNWNSFKQILLEAQDKHVPHRMSTMRHNIPWFNQKLRRLCNKKQRLYNKSKKSDLVTKMTLQLSKNVVPNIQNV